MAVASEGVNGLPCFVKCGVLARDFEREEISFQNTET